MGFYRDQILARAIPIVLNSGEHKKLRARVAEGLAGDVIELGFGAGLNLLALPSEVQSVHAVDPDRVGQRLAKERIEQSPVDVLFAGLNGERLDVDSASMDAALSTWTLCTIPNIGQALGELRRVLKPGGRFHFLEHGLSEERGIARWQQRLTPVQKVWAGGCRLDEDMERHIQEAGFEIAELDRFYMKGPKIASYMYCGVAINPA